MVWSFVMTVALLFSGPNYEVMRGIRECCVLTVLIASSLPTPMAAQSAMKDSAGVRIVENARPVWPAGRGWALSLQPTIDIGSGEDSLYELRPMDIGNDYELGLWRDADDVEHVRMYRLTKPGPA
jgi:hypothetical protein